MFSIKRFCKICLLLMISIFLVSCSKTNISKDEKEDNLGTEITLSSVGDILIHDDVLKAAYDKKSDTYDFKPSFTYVKKYLKKSDLTIANLQTTLGGKEKRYAGYPYFNSPDEVTDALKDVGVDILTGANNHILDSGEKGFLRTVKTVQAKGLNIIGVKSEPNEKSYMIKDIKGIKVGISNFTYETERIKGVKNLNGAPITETIEPLIDTVDMSKLDETYKILEKRVFEMKRNGAEVLIFCMHWGKEYERMPSKEQELVAKKLSDLGIDIILGAHTHVLQPIDFIHSDVSKKDTFVIYSQGNFLSNQRVETIKNRNSEDGIIVNIGIRKSFKDNQIKITFANYIPTWVNKKYINNKPFYEIIPTEDVLKGGKYPNINEDDKKRIATSNKETKDLMEKFTKKATMASIENKN